MSGSRCPLCFFVADGRNNGGIDQRPFPLASGRQVAVYGDGNALRQLMCFQLVAELEQGRRIGSRIPAQVDTDKGADGRTLTSSPP